jgi:hypothetical protein
VKASKSGSVIRLGGNLDESNWIVWQAKIRTALETCGMLEYITGAVECPNFSINPQGWCNWGSNDAFTCMQIQCNLRDTQMVHVNQCKTALEMWRSLEGVHDNRGHQALIVYMRNLYCHAAEEGDNIIEHLNKMQEGHEHINLMGNTCFYIPDTTFKLLICQSLPLSWDNYTDAYIGSQTFAADDPRTSISCQKFIGLLKTEYNCRAGCKLDMNLEVNFVKMSTHSLASHISSQLAGGRTFTKVTSPICKLCNTPGHPTDECTHFKKKCHNCNNFGHKEATCYYEKINCKCKTRSGNHSGCRGKRRHPTQGKPPKSEQTTHIEEVEEEVIFQSTECDDEIPVDTEYDNFNDNVVVTYENGETLIPSEKSINGDRCRSTQIEAKRSN